MKQFVGPFPMDIKPVREGVYGVTIEDKTFRDVVHAVGFSRYQNGQWMYLSPSQEQAARTQFPEHDADLMTGWFGIER